MLNKFQNKQSKDISQSNTKPLGVEYFTSGSMLLTTASSCFGFLAFGKQISALSKRK